MKQKQNISLLTDEKLIARYVKTGDKLLVGELFKRYTRFVFLVSIKYLKNEDACKDAVMQIFEKLFEDLKKHKVEKFKPWLYTVTRNYCLLEIRDTKTQRKKEDEIKNDMQVMESGSFTYLTNEDTKETELQKLEKALSQLNDEQKQCVELFYIQEKSYIEVTAITGYSLKKVKSYIQNGKRNLKNLLLKMSTLYFLIGLRMIN